MPSGTYKNGLSAKAQELPLFSSSAPSLTPSDAKIANFIADHLTEFMQMTISELSSSIEVSEITISRFCKKFDLPGLQALKIALSKELNTNPVRDISSNDNCREITSTIFSNLQEGLSNSLNLLDFKIMDAAADCLNNAGRLLLFGYGNSATVCQDMATRFVRLGKSCEVSSDPHQQMTLASICSSNTAVIAVSYTGSSVNLVAALKRARESGAKIVLITSHKNSPASKQADFTLIGLGPEVRHNSEASTSRLIHMAIGDVLYTKISFLQNKEFEHNMQRMREAIASLKS